MGKYYTKIFPDKESKKIFTIIPAAGMGTRMKSHGSQSLIKIDDEYLINKQISIIKSVFPQADLAVVTGFCSEKVMNSISYDVMRLENSVYYSTNVVRSVAVGLRAKQYCEELLIVLGDLYFNKEALTFLDLNKSCITLTDAMTSDEVGCVVEDNNNISNMMYDLPSKWSQIIYLKGKELELFKKYVFNNSNKTKFMFEAINYIIEKRGRIKSIYDKSIISYDIDSIKDIQHIKEKYENSIRK